MEDRLIYNNEFDRFAIKEIDKGYVIMKQVEVMHIPQPGNRHMVVITDKRNVKNGIAIAGSQILARIWGKN